MQKLKQVLRNSQFIRAFYYRFIALRERFSYRLGHNNTIEKCGGVKIHTLTQIIGNNNIIIIKKKALLKNCKISIHGNNNKIIINEEAVVSGATIWIEDNNCNLSIGERTFIGASHLAMTEDNSSLKIGADCMVSSNVYFRTGDSHSIIENKTRQRINFADNIVVSDHVWIGEGAKILKGVTIEPNSIVSTGAIVTGNVPSCTLVGGIPAKIIKENITWDKNRL